MICFRYFNTCLLYKCRWANGLGEIKMPHVHDVQTFLYTMDGDKTIEQNLEETLSNIRLMLSNRAKVNGNFDFQIRLDIKLTDNEGMEAKELNESLIKVFADAQKIEASELLPVAVDKNGDPVYQRREDIQRQLGKDTK